MQICRVFARTSSSNLSIGVEILDAHVKTDEPFVVAEKRLMDFLRRNGKQRQKRATMRGVFYLH